jgi:hypothetical protein
LGIVPWFTACGPPAYDEGTACRYRAHAMAYEWTAICDACGTRQTFQIESFRAKFPHRPLPAGWMHVHEGGRPGEITPEIGVACSRACLAKARRILLARRA